MGSDALQIFQEDVVVPLSLEDLHAYCFRLADFLHVSLENVCLIFCAPHYIQELNAEFRGQSVPTDVLSFPMEKKEGLSDVLMGDIYFCWEMIQEQAQEYGIEVLDELHRLVIHSFLHLQGWKHETYDKNEPMFLQQEKIFYALQGD